MTAMALSGKKGALRVGAAVGSEMSGPVELGLPEATHSSLPHFLELPEVPQDTIRGHLLQEGTRAVSRCIFYGSDILVADWECWWESCTDINFQERCEVWTL